MGPRGGFVCVDRADTFPLTWKVRAPEAGCRGRVSGPLLELRVKVCTWPVGLLLFFLDSGHMWFCQ